MYRQQKYEVDIVLEKEKRKLLKRIDVKKNT